MPSIKKIFHRADKNSDGAIDRNEIKKVATDAGINRGLLGAAKVNKVADHFMDTFDTDPKDGRVSWQEFEEKGGHLLPEELKSSLSNSRPGELERKIGQQFNEVDTDHDAKLSHKELTHYIEKELKKAGVSAPGTKADISAKLAMEILDENKDKHLSRQEVSSLIKDIVRRFRMPDQPIS